MLPLGIHSLRFSPLKSLALLSLACPVFAAPRVATVVRADSHSGRLVRSVVVKTTEAPPAPADLSAMISQIAAEQGVEESLVHSVIRVESNYNAWAVSPKGAQGLMQLIPATARRFGVANAFDVRANVEGGVKYLKFLLDYYKGDYARTIAAYNAGERAVDKYNGVPPYAETRNYVVRVSKNLNAARDRQPAAQIEKAEAPAPPQFNAVVASIGEDGLRYYRTP